MKLKDFAYDLPEDLIAQDPLTNRDESRLMVLDRKRKSMAHDIFANIGNYLPQRSCIVLNNSKVIPARLLGYRASGGQVEIFLLKKLKDGYSYEVLLRPQKKLKNNEKIYFNPGHLVAKIVDKDERIVSFNKKNLISFLDRFGHMPLPPYIRRADKTVDRKYYQTVYAKKEGSVAAPTAGLHFTKQLLSKLQKEGHQIVEITLHVNYGTFKPVEQEDVTSHAMHCEDYHIFRKTYDAIRRAKNNQSSVVAVGTTSCRVLETIAENGILKGDTDKFIYPGYHFRLVDALITNFHLPFSTLLMLVCAFGSQELVMQAYQDAIKMKYRFYSYGDAMLII